MDYLFLNNQVFVLERQNEMYNNDQGFIEYLTAPSTSLE